MEVSERTLREEVFAVFDWDATASLRLILAYYYDDIKAATINGTRVNLKNPQQYVAIADYNLSKRTDVFFGACPQRLAELGQHCLPA